MKSLSPVKLSRVSGLLALFFLLLSCPACSYEPLSITGTVVDESGSPVSDVSVWACYSDWGWGKEGYLVWDKETCSETVQTDEEGMYAISFTGPASSRLRVSKEGWIQSDSYNATHSRIVMTKSADYSARLRDAVKQRALQRCKPEASETDMGYYCRVVRADSRPVRLQYLDEIMIVTPTILENENQATAIFSVQGGLRAIEAFAKELVLMIDGEKQDLSFSIKADEADCAEGLYFLELRTQGMDAWGNTSVDLLVPSIKAMFEANLHACPSG